MLARGIRGASKWKKKFLKPMRHTGRIRVEEQVLQQELARANALRERFWKMLEPFYLAASEKEVTVSEMTKALYDLLCGLHLEEQMKEQQEAFEEAWRRIAGVSVSTDLQNRDRSAG